MALDKEKIRINYLNRNALLKRTFDCCGFTLKYDYTDDKNIDKFARIVSHKIPSNYQLFDQKEETPFVEHYLSVLYEFGNEKLYDLMTMYYLKTNVLKDKNKTIEDCRGGISKNENNENIYSINGPDQDNTSLLYASYIHELFHFPQLIQRNNKEYYEYSEVISMYFEYLMYEELFPNMGYSVFVNNRLSLLDDLRNDFCDDIITRRNYEFFKIPKETFSILLADYASYYEGIEYVLNLIELNKSDPKEVKNMIARVLFDRSSCKIEAEKHGINTLGCNKLIKKL